MSKKVYVALAADIIHEGHINILKKASSYGKVIVGLLTDDPDEEIYYENMPQRAREELMVLQKYVCKTLDVKPEDFSSIGSDDRFIYSVEPFLS